MIFGMLPVALGVGEGAETRAPMGIAVIGGLITSLFLTLIVVPSAYDIFDDWQEYFKKTTARQMLADAIMLLKTMFVKIIIGIKKSIEYFRRNSIKDILTDLLTILLLPYRMIMWLINIFKNKRR
jgi:hypothetical protein